MCMKTTGEARLCINGHLRCSVSFQTSRISTNLLQQIYQLLFNKQYQRVKFACCSLATGRSPASIASFPWPFALGGHKEPGTSAAGQAGERCSLTNPSIALWCSAQKLGRKSQWTGQWWNIQAISRALPAEEETGTGRLEETIQRQQKSFCCLQHTSFCQLPLALCLELSWHPAPVSQSVGFMPWFPHWQMPSSRHPLWLQRQGGFLGARTICSIELAPHWLKTRSCCTTSLTRLSFFKQETMNIIILILLLLPRLWLR